MGKVIRGCRRGKGSVYTSHTVHRKGANSFKALDYAERHGYCKGVVKSIIHDSARGAPFAKIQFKHAYRYKRINTTVVSPEGMYSGQFIYAGKKAAVAIGNILPLSSIPEGTVICNIEESPGDGGKMARASGDYAVIVAQDHEKGTARVRLPSGSKRTCKHTCRAMIGLVAGGGRTDKPLLKAGRAFHKYRVKRNEWPRVRCVAMNAVDHPHGGGNQQHMGKPGTCSRLRCAGAKAGQIAARRTGRVRGGGTKTDDL
eukprot:CAMPEP_0182425156 /NCGR_PEP_ID=MMETSP1167-20130531/11517_1 /TAXON_ID=2988 /ORGANISM="Mallomonas Sp, Strain CCMP3275" /LENGTH=256 /DNA_ID=CAMNT_0024605593 /DNA_START=37 /DNA_END=807 /DNA_ORIENTATION=-